MEEFSKLMANSLSSDGILRRTGKYYFYHLSSAEQTINNLIVDAGTLEIFFNYLTSNENLQRKQAAAVMLMRYIKDFWVKLGYI